MSTAAESTPATRSAGAPPPAALLFELEGAALPIRPVLFEAARAHFESRQTRLDMAMFARCGGPISTLAAQLIGLLRLNDGASELADALNGALADQFNAGRIPLNPGMAKLLDAAARRGLTAAALTGLPEALAKKAFHAAGFEGRGIQLFVFSDEDKLFPRADAWLKAAKQLGKTARFCVAVGSSHATCKSALSAGLRTIAAPDAFTGHHDFSGADVIVESWDDIDINTTLDDLIPSLR